MCKRFTRILALLAATCLVILSITGMGEAEKSKAKEGTAAGTAAVKPLEKVKLTFLVPSAPPPGSPYTKYFQEKFNVEVETITEPTNYSQKVYTVMASGDLPDYLLINNLPDLNKFATEGLIVPLDQYLEKAPNLKKNVAQVCWNLATINGKIFGMPFQRYDPSPYLAYVQKAWVDNLGIDVNAQRSVEDYYKMLSDFVKKDPDKNGKDDTVGWAVTKDNAYSLEIFSDAFDALRYQVVDGQLKPSYMLPGYKDWLKFMNRLYKEKILDPEWVVTSKTQVWEKVNSKKYGIVMAFWSLVELQGLGGKRDDVVAMRPAMKVNGSGESKYIYDRPVRHYICVTNKSKYAERIVAMMDWAASEEGGVFVYAGLEGVNYDMKEGKIVMRPDNKPEDYGVRFSLTGMQDANLTDKLNGILAMTNGARGIADLNLSTKYGAFNELYMYAPNFRELANYNFTAMVSEFKTKGIIGTVNVDGEWDNYVAAWRKAGGDVWLKVNNDWYNKTVKK